MFRLSKRQAICTQMYVYICVYLKIIKYILTFFLLLCYRYIMLPQKKSSKTIHPSMKIPGRALRAVLGEGPRGGLGAVAVAAGDHSSCATAGPAGRRSKGVAPGMRSAGGCGGLQCTWLGKIHGAWDGLVMGLPEDLGGNSLECNM